MDRNQIIGIVIIVAILIGYSVYMMPSEQEKAEMKRKTDSVELVLKNKVIIDSVEKAKADSLEKLKKTTPADSISSVSDTTQSVSLDSQFGIFAPAGKGIEKSITLMNNEIKLKISTLGAYPVYCELKEYKTHDSLPLVLFEGKENTFDLNFYYGNKVIDSEIMYFTPNRSDTLLNASTSAQTLIMRMEAGLGKYIEYKYTLKPESYIVDFDLKFVGLEKEIAQQQSYMDFFWNNSMRRLEKGADWENQNSTVYFKHLEEEVDYLTETSDNDIEKITTPVKWLAYKNQFFTAAFIAKSSFLNTTTEFKKDELQNKYLKHIKSRLSIPFDKKPNETLAFSYYFGPNQYKILEDLTLTDKDDLQMEKMIPLGWGIFGWVNRFAIIPIFNWLGSYFSSYGLIILLLTLIIKLSIFPLTYKSYKSTAKMRVLKPQIDEINEKIPKENTLERQKKTMELYKKVGVNPMGGCIPMLLQMPILIAMFRFFPASIELRQQSFLWATDLSTYDSILDFPGGFSIPFYGDHISLFALLMAAAMLVQTLLNPTQMTGANQSMPGMKLMMYLMPVMMVFWFNSYSSGLSYYYFLSNIVTIGQTLLISKFFINETDILAQLNAKKATSKPKPKSKFQEKLEQIQKQQQLQSKNNRYKK